MMYKTKSAIFDPRESLSKNWAVANMVVVIAIMTLYLFQYLTPTYFSAIWTRFGYAAVAISTAIYLYHRRLSGTVEVKLLAFYALWVFITRWLNRDFLLNIDLSTVYSVVLSFLIFSAAILLNKEQRSKAMNWACAIIGCYIFILSVIGVFIALTGVTLRVPPEMKYIGLYSQNEGGNGFYTIAYFQCHRNTSAVWFYIGLMMMIYQFFACKRKLWRAPIVVAAISEYVMVSITHSRTVQVAMAFSIALVLFVIVLKYIKSNNKTLSAALLVVLVSVFTFLGYKVADVTAEGISSLSERTTPAFTQWYKNLDNQISELYFTPAGTYEEETTGGDLTDTRDFISNAKTLTGRTTIWKSVFSVAKSRPMIMLKGTLSNCLMEEPQKYISFPAGHMHNSLLEVLMLTGIPGFLLICAFCFVLCIHMLKLMFSKAPTVSISIKLLTIPVFGLLLDYMMEAALFTDSYLSPNCFFLFAGMAMAAYYDVFPDMKLKLKK